MGKPLLIAWTIEDWPLARRWADTVGFPSDSRDAAVFYAYVSAKKKKLSLFDAFDEPELSPESTDQGFWIAQLGLSAAGHAGDVHARWKLDHGFHEGAVHFQLGPHFSSKPKDIGFGFHASVTLDDAVAVLVEDGFDVKLASTFLEPEGTPRDLEGRTYWLEDPTAMNAFLQGQGPPVDFDRYDGVLDRAQHWTEFDRRVLTFLAERGDLPVVMMRRLCGTTAMVDEAAITQSRLSEWGFSTEFSLAADGTYPPEHGCSATYAALSMSRDIDELLAHLRTCGSEEPGWMFGEVIRLLAFFAPTNTLQDFFTSRIETLLAASPDLELTRQGLNDPDTILVLNELGIALE